VSRFAASKTFTFPYGHRIEGHEGPCRDLHGHNARVEIECEGELDALGMVIDFGRITATVGKWIDEHWDHRTVLFKDDPLVTVLREANQPVFELDRPPTAECMAQHLFHVAQRAGLPVTEVRFWESEKNLAVYSER